MTNEVAQFINEVVLHEDIIKTCKSGEKVEYVKCDTFSDKPFEVLSKILMTGVKYDDIFILSPSIRHNDEKSPINLLANICTRNKIPIFIPRSDDEKVDDEQLIGKISFMTFHQAKGLERKCVMLFCFDNAYFELYNKEDKLDRCPNPIYVAMTRATEKLVILHDNQNTPFNFIDKEKLYKLTSVKLDNINNIDSRDDCPKISVTSLCRHLDHKTITKAMSLIKKEKLNTEVKMVKVMDRVKNEDLGTIEAVSDITGIAVPLYFQLTQEGKTADIKKLLKVATEEYCKENGLDYRKFQIKDFNWIKQDELD